MSHQKSLSRLTRSLVVGSSAGAIALQVGCAAVPPTADRPMAEAGRATVSVASQAEGEACLEAIRTRSVSAAVALMTEFPSSRCIPLVLNSLSPAALAAIPASAVAGLSPAIRAQVPPGTAGVSVAPSSASILGPAGNLVTSY